MKMVKRLVKFWQCPICKEKGDGQAPALCPAQHCRSRFVAQLEKTVVEPEGLEVVHGQIN